MTEEEQAPRLTPSAHGGTEEERVGHAAQTDLATSVLAYLLAGPLGFGALGWLGNWYFDVWWLLPIGIILGMAQSMYVIWLRYGRS